MKKTVTIFLIAVISVTGLVGCGAGDAAKPESISTPEKVENMVEMRKIFDKNNGNWDSASAEDKAQYTKLAGTTADASRWWKRMGNPPGGYTQSKPN